MTKDGDSQDHDDPSVDNGCDAAATGIEMIEKKRTSHDYDDPAEDGDTIPPTKLTVSEKYHNNHATFKVFM